MYTSSSGNSASDTTSIPSDRPSAPLASLEATQRIFSPAFTRSPSAWMNITDVVPVPSPTAMPSSTISAARLPTSALASSCVMGTSGSKQ
jgi:hypothetical protein